MLIAPMDETGTTLRVTLSDFHYFTLTTLTPTLDRGHGVVSKFSHVFVRMLLRFSRDTCTATGC